MNKQEPDIFQLGIKALIKNNEGKILVLKANPKYKYRTSTKKVYWDLPGGRLHKDHTIEATLKREVKEEIGIENIKIEKLLDASISKHRPTDKHGLILFTILCSINHTEKITLTDDEHLNFEWCTPKLASKLLSDKFSNSLCKIVKNL